MAAPSAPSGSARFPWGLSIALVVGTLLLFSRALPYDFINYDDPQNLTNNPQVRAGLTWMGTAWAFVGRSDYWQPLVWLSHMLDWQLFGANATGHRTVNLLWHAANTVLVLHLFRRLQVGTGTAFVIAALFAWHPLRVESIVWVTERKDVLSGCFFLLTLLAYTSYLDRLRAGRPALGSYSVTLGLFLVGLMCKPSLVTLPGVLLILDFWPGRRLEGGTDVTRRLVRVLGEKVPFLLLSGGVAVLTVVMQREIGAFVLEVAPADRAGNALVSVVRYLGKFFWPTNLVICYPHPGSWPWPTIAGAAAVCGTISLAAWRGRARRPWIAAGWFWYLLVLLPMLGFLQVGFQAMADRYSYIAILGWEWALVATVATLPLPRRVLVAAAAASLTVAAILTWHQQGYWRDSATLFRHALAVDARNHFVQAFLGVTYVEEGRPVEAEHHARIALDLAPDNRWALLALAGAQTQTGKLADAAETYRKLLEHWPGYFAGRVARATVLAQLGRLAEATEEQARAVALAPYDIELRKSLAELLARRRLFREAAVAYQEILAIDPTNAHAHAGLGYMLVLTDRRNEAAQHWREALRLQPDFPGLRERLQRLPP
jgi:tetratricopeptide (TPR) repeat protein